MSKTGCWFCGAEFYEHSALPPVDVTVTNATLWASIFWTRVVWSSKPLWATKSVKVPGCPQCYESHLANRSVALWSGAVIGGGAAIPRRFPAGFWPGL